MVQCRQKYFDSGKVTASSMSCLFWLIPPVEIMTGRPGGDFPVGSSHCCPHWDFDGDISNSTLHQSDDFSSNGGHVWLDLRMALDQRCKVFLG